MQAYRDVSILVYLVDVLELEGRGLRMRECDRVR